MDSLTVEPQHNVLNPEQIIRCDKDFATINSIQSFALTVPGVIPVVTGGYAVEAHCGGIITRPHNDIDIHIASLPISDRASFTQGLKDVLDLESHTKWTFHQGNDFGWAQAIEFREVAPEKASVDKRKVELKLKAFSEETTDRFLIDSKGNVINIQVTELHRLIARKIKTLRDSEGQTTGRLTMPRDFIELRRLLAVGGFDKSEAITKLSLMYKTEEGLSLGQAQTKAISEWEKVLR